MVIVDLEGVSGLEVKSIPKNSQLEQILYRPIFLFSNQKYFYDTTGHVELCPPLYWSFLITHKQTGLLWTCDEVVAEDSTYRGQHNIITQ
jgi:hypothetical protein